MALKNIAVDGCAITPQGIVSGGTLTITSLPSTKMKAGGKNIYTSPLTFTLAGANATGYDPGTVVTAGPASILSTAVKTIEQGSLVIREEDQVIALMTGTISGTPTPFQEVFKITDAGQAKVVAQ